MMSSVYKYCGGTGALPGTVSLQKTLLFPLQIQLQNSTQRSLLKEIHRIAPSSCYHEARLLQAKAKTQLYILEMMVCVCARVCSHTHTINSELTGEPFLKGSQDKGGWSYRGQAGKRDVGAQEVTPHYVTPHLPSLLLPLSEVKWPQITFFCDFFVVFFALKRKPSLSHVSRRLRNVNTFV